MGHAKENEILEKVFKTTKKKYSHKKTFDSFIFSEKADKKFVFFCVGLFNFLWQVPERNSRKNPSKLSYFDLKSGRTKRFFVLASLIFSENCSEYFSDFSKKMFVDFTIPDKNSHTSIFDLV